MNNKPKKNLFEHVKGLDIKNKAMQVGAIVTGGVLTSLAMGSGPKATQINKQVDVLNKTEVAAQVELKNSELKMYDSYKDYREAEKGTGIEVKTRDFYIQDLKNRITGPNKFFDDAISKIEVEIADLKCRAQPDGQMGGLRFGQVPQLWVKQAEERLEKKKSEKASYIAEIQSQLSIAKGAGENVVSKYINDNPDKFFATIDDATKQKYLQLEELKVQGDSNLDSSAIVIKEKGEEISNIRMEKANLKPAQDNANNVNTIAYTVGGVAGSFAFKKKKKPGEE